MKRSSIICSLLAAALSVGCSAAAPEDAVAAAVQPLLSQQAWSGLTLAGTHLFIVPQGSAGAVGTPLVLGTDRVNSQVNPDIEWVRGHVGSSSGQLQWASNEAYCISGNSTPSDDRAKLNFCGMPDTDDLTFDDIVTNAAGQCLLATSSALGAGLVWATCNQGSTKWTGTGPGFVGSIATSDFDSSGHRMFVGVGAGNAVQEQSPTCPFGVCGPTASQRWDAFYDFASGYVFLGNASMGSFTSPPTTYIVGILSSAVMATGVGCGTTWGFGPSTPGGDPLSARFDSSCGSYFSTFDAANSGLFYDGTDNGFYVGY
jgi:hypothetical protein